MLYEEFIPGGIFSRRHTLIIIQQKFVLRAAGKKKKVYKNNLKIYLL